MYPREREEKKDAWAMCDCDCELSSPPSPTPRRAAPKAVDEDLYKISPHLLRQQAKRVTLFFFQFLFSISLHYNYDNEICNLNVWPPRIAVYT